MAAVNMIEFKKLENNFVKCFDGLVKTQNLFAASRIKFENGHVTSTTFMQRLCTYMLIIKVNIGSFLYHLGYYQFFGDNVVLIRVGDNSVMWQLIFIVSNMIYIRHWQKEYNIYIYYMLQKVDRIMQIDKRSYYLEYQRKRRVILTYAIVITFMTCYVLHTYFLFEGIYWFLALGYGGGMLLYFLDVLGGISMMYFLGVRIYLLNRIMKYHVKSDSFRPTKTRPRITKDFAKWFLSKVLIPSDECYYNEHLELNRWVECVQQVTTSYTVITDLYCYQIVSVTIMLMSWFVLSVVMVVLSLRTNSYPIQSICMLVASGIAYYVALLFTAIVNDWLVHQLNRTKIMCVRLMKTHLEGEYYKVASRILRSVHAANLRFRIYGIFNMNIEAVVAFIGLLASSTLVAIQLVIKK